MSMRLVFCALALFAALTSVSDAFEVPDFEKKLFELDSVFLEPGEQLRVTDALAALAANFPGYAKVTPDLQAKALALALRLDGVHRPARATLSKLEAGEIPDTVAGFPNPEVAAAALWEVAEAMDVSDAGQDDRLLACYLIDIAMRIDPDRSEGVERFQRLSLAASYNGWQGVIGTATTSSFEFPPSPLSVSGVVPEPGELVSREAAGRVITSNPSRRPAAGLVLPVQATVIVGALDNPMTVRFLDIDGDEVPGLERVAAFLPGAVAASGVAWPYNGGSMSVTIGGDYHASNREGIALTAGLLARCMIAGGEMGAQVAAAGGLSEDGWIEALRDPLSLLRGLGRGTVPVVLLPSANVSQLLDLAILGDFGPFLRHQIFVAPDLATAFSLVVDPSEATIKARELFAEVQDLASIMPPGDLIANSKVQEYFAKIIKLAPEHASAGVLLRSGRGDLPELMSRSGSIYLLNNMAAPVVRVVAGRGDPYVEGAAAIFAPSKRGLRDARAVLHPDALPLATALSEIIGEIEVYLSLGDRDSDKGKALEKKIASSWSALRKAFRKLRSGNDQDGEPPSDETRE